jgi:hypothetical protein
MTVPGSANPLLLRSSAPAGYQIQRSIRLNSADSAFLSRTPASAGNRKTWTWAGWVKRSRLGTNQRLFTSQSGTIDAYLRFRSDDTLQLFNWNGSTGVLDIRSTQVFRDTSAWLHVVVSFNTASSTNTDRIKVYVNNSQITAWSTAGWPAQNLDTDFNIAGAHYISGDLANAEYFNGYLADVHFIDGQALTPTSFGEFDTNNVWQPKAYSGTYGTNGFKLDFADNSAATATTLGKDTSGNGNNCTPNNLSVTAGAGNDSLVDSPTNYGTDTGIGGSVRGNYCTFDPLAFSNAGTVNWTLANGNLDAGDPDSCYGVVPGTIGVSSGKYYWELTFTGGSIGSTDYWGIERCDNRNRTRFPGNYENAYWFRADGNKASGTGAASSYGSSFTLTDKAGIAFDADNGTLTFYKNGTSLGTAFTGIDTSQPWRLVIGNAANTTSITTWTLNTGQRSFAYTAPSGFKALCTQNLPTPTITDGRTAMDAVLYTGNGGTQAISGLSLSPDLVWIKSRSNTYFHNLIDSVRGGSLRLSSNSTSAEDNGSAGGATPLISTFNSDGFTLPNGNLNTNGSAATYVAWAWDAGSSTVTNTSGTISSQVRANASAGFSIVTYTGTGANATVGHGLGAAPQMVIVKSRVATANTNWAIYHVATGASAWTPFTTEAAFTSVSGSWNNTNPTSTVFSVGTFSIVNESSKTYVAYCFAPVAGYSAFGSYIGNGSTDGPFVFCNFRPRWIMLKRTNSTGNWTIMDAARKGYNVGNDSLYPNLADADFVAGLADILSNGFKLRSTDTSVNLNGSTYIYAAFAESPFALARAR